MPFETVSDASLPDAIAERMKGGVHRCRRVCLVVGEDMSGNSVFDSSAGEGTTVFVVSKNDFAVKDESESAVDALHKSVMLVANGGAGVAITFGTFDLFHEGHRNLLRRIARMGRSVVVGIPTDEHVLTGKGVVTTDDLATRTHNVLSVDGVTDVIVEDSYGSNPASKKGYIVRHRANVFASGDDWWNRGLDSLHSACRVVYVERTPDVSSTALRQAG